MSSTTNTTNGKITALYERLSVGDEQRNGGDSNSIVNQKYKLEEYAKAHGFTNIRHYTEMITLSLIQFNPISSKMSGCKNPNGWVHF